MVWDPINDFYLLLLIPIHLNCIILVIDDHFKNRLKDFYFLCHTSNQNSTIIHKIHRISSKPQANYISVISLTQSSHTTQAKPAQPKSKVFPILLKAHFHYFFKQLR